MYLVVYRLLPGRSFLLHGFLSCLVSSIPLQRTLRGQLFLETRRNTALPQADRQCCSRNIMRALILFA